MKGKNREMTIVYGEAYKREEEGQLEVAIEIFEAALAKERTKFFRELLSEEVSRMKAKRWSYEQGC